MELYASGDLGEVILEASKIGLFEVFRQHASPTCQVGIMNNVSRVHTDENKLMAMQVLKDIQDNTFTKQLNHEASSGFSQLEEYNDKNASSLLSRTHKDVGRLIKYRIE